MRDIKNIDKLSDNNHKIDILSLNKFLLEKEDNFLNEIISEKYTFIKREDITKEFFQLNYKKIFHGESIGDLGFLGKDFPIEWYDRNIIKHITSNYFIYGVNEMIKLFPKEIFNSDVLLTKLLGFNINFFKLIPKDKPNYYKYVHMVFNYHNDFIWEDWFPKEYIPQLRKDFPDNLILKNYIQLKNLSENKNSLLREEYMNVSKLESKSNTNQIDLESLSDFLVKEKDDYLNILLQIKKYKEIDINNKKIHDYYLINCIKARLYSRVPKELWDNYSFSEKAIDYHIESLFYVRSELPGYYSFCEKIVSGNDARYNERYNNGLALQYVEKEFIDYPLCEKAVNSTGNALEHVPDNLKDYSLCEKALNNTSGLAIRFVPKTMENYYSLVKLAFYTNSFTITSIPIEYFPQLIIDFPKKKERIEAEITRRNEKNNSLLKEEYRYVLTNSDVYLTKKIEAVSDKNKFDAIAFDKYLLSFGNNDLHKILFNKRYIIPSKERFQKNYMNILRKNNTVKNIHGYDDEKYGYLSSLIPKEYYTKEMIDKIVEHFGLFTVVKKSLINQNVDGFANLVKEYIRNRAVYSILTNINPYIEGYYDLFKYAIEENPFSIKYLNTEFDRYEELALFAVSISADVLFYIPEYKRSYDVCLKAVSENGFLIKRVPEDVENYYSLVKVAYLQNRDSINETNLNPYYIDMLKKDFPEDKELQKKKGFDDVFDDPYNFLQEYISKQVKKLLKESIYKKGNF